MAKQRKRRRKPLSSLSGIIPDENNMSKHNLQSRMEKSKEEREKEFWKLIKDMLADPNRKWSTFTYQVHSVRNKRRSQ
jgi:hypothetical protein